MRVRIFLHIPINFRLFSPKYKISLKKYMKKYLQLINKLILFKYPI